MQGTSERRVTWSLVLSSLQAQKNIAFANRDKFYTPSPFSQNLTAARWVASCAR
jgi:hypothetical protein